MSKCPICRRRTLLLKPGNMIANKTYRHEGALFVVFSPAEKKCAYCGYTIEVHAIYKCTRYPYDYRPRGIVVLRHVTHGIAYSLPVIRCFCG